MSQNIDMSSRARIDQFLNLVDGRLLETKTRASYETPIYRHTLADDELVPTAQRKTEETCVIEIPTSSLESMYDVHDWYRRNQGGYSMEKFDKMIRSNIQEEHIRNTNPSVNKAWEQYQIILNLSK